MKKKHLNTYYILATMFVLFSCSYPLTLQAQTGSCIGTASLAVVIEDCTYIDEAVFDKLYTMFPNPASETITIQCADAAPQNATVTLLNMVGQTLLRTPFSGQIMLNISNYPAGLYLITVQSGQKLAGKRVVIQ